ncbi:AIR synthase family protein [[Clostridium] polysaccharolyticum]|uniref:Hydrogenase maturation factor n=1 Tax=[Clostridium] polysaccharolyticum TaxID=29364 RepID=A0A1I0E997_9FIRM|nr:AIR synthase family protein [[Clostridium] polysaccharolyticum]SET41439.1 Hydrogenase maturation factor [[Clostridium] polysaccharolyticum]
MKIGKIPETVLKRSVFKQIHHRRNEVLLRPGVGEDCAMLQVGPDEVLVMSTDPITGTTKEIGTFAVHVTANDIASSGAEPIGILLTLILPEQISESDIKQIMKEAEAVCEELNIEIMGGHTEVSKAVNQPLISVTGIGKIKKNEMLKTAGLKPGQELVMTKWAGLEGTAILAKEKENELRGRFHQDFIDRAKEMFQYISVVREAKIAKMMGVSSMHDVTEGGIFGALWEAAAASGAGIEVDLKKIPIKQETIEICEIFDLNPYMLMSSGCMLISTDKGNALVEALKNEGISSAIIGRVIKGNDRIIINEDEKRYLEPPKTDELYKAFK